MSFRDTATPLTKHEISKGGSAVDNVLTKPREATSTSTGASTLASVVVCDTEDREDRQPEVRNILLELNLTLPASGGGEKERREGSSK